MLILLYLNYVLNDVNILIYIYDRRVQIFSTNSEGEYRIFHHNLQPCLLLLATNASVKTCLLSLVTKLEFHIITCLHANI